MKQMSMKLLIDKILPYTKLSKSKLKSSRFICHQYHRIALELSFPREVWQTIKDTQCDYVGNIYC